MASTKLVPISKSDLLRWIITTLDLDLPNLKIEVFSRNFYFCKERIVVQGIFQPC